MQKTKIKQKNIITNIVSEISEIPDEYLQTLYAIIHSFRTNLPGKSEDITQQKDDFNWNGLVDDIYTNRRKNNEKMFNNVKDYENISDLKIENWTI